MTSIQTAALTIFTGLFLIACASPPPPAMGQDLSDYYKVENSYYNKSIDSATADLIQARFSLGDKSGKIRIDVVNAPAGVEYRVNITDPPSPSDRKVGCRWHRIGRKKDGELISLERGYCWDNY